MSNPWDAIQTVILESHNEYWSSPEEKSSLAIARRDVSQYIHPAPKVAFTDIIGNDEALALLRDAIQAPILQKKLYEAYGLKMPKGAMLSGPPGCGKTMFAKAAVCEMKKLYGKATEYISISGSEIHNGYVGGVEKNIKAIFNYAREYKKANGHPLLVFIDEADVLFPSRTGRRELYLWELNAISTFLAEMDGMQESGAFVLLATNRPEAIDSALLRDGRCDFKITISAPTHEAVLGILNKNFSGPYNDDRDILVNAAFESLYDPNKIILEPHLIEAKFSFSGNKPPEFSQKIKAIRHFCLEHIINGAMVASIPMRAKRHAFARDKKLGSVSGITVMDVVNAVNDIYEENKNLDHSFHLNEFMQEFIKEINEEGN